jgi:hypothetical protein
MPVRRTFPAALRAAPASPHATTPSVARQIRPESRWRRVRRRLFILSIVAVVSSGGVVVAARNMYAIRFALGISPWDRDVSPEVQAEIYRIAREPIRFKIRYPRRILELLAEGESRGKNVVEDYETFQRAWSDRYSEPCTLALTTNLWEMKDPITGFVSKASKAEWSEIERRTGERIRRIKLDSQTWAYIVDIAKIARESDGTGRGISPQTKYEYEPADQPDAPQPSADDLPSPLLKNDPRASSDRAETLRATRPSPIVDSDAL